MHVRIIAGWLLLLWLLAAQADRPPNYYLGTCLDTEWVTETEARLGTTHTARDADGRLENSFLQSALQHPRYHVCASRRR